MIHEYALQPDALSTWTSFQIFFDQFGFSKGRVISKYPKHWKRLVYQAVERQQPTALERARIEESLRTIDDRLLEQKRAYNGEMDWLENAIDVDRVNPFKAIIAKVFPSPCLNAVVADEVDEAHPLWLVETQRIVARTPEGMTESIGPALRVSSEIIFVDPHFDPDAYRFREPLEAFVSAALVGGIAVKRIEYHFKDDQRTKPQFNEHFEETCRRKLAPLVPVGSDLRLVRWKERSGGKGFHARYVLTEKGGFLVENGLDEGNEGETTPIVLLSSALHAEVWTDFQKHEDISQCTYEFDNEMIIAGTKEVER